MVRVIRSLRIIPLPAILPEHFPDNGIINDLKVTVDAKNNSGIVTHTFLVDRTAICERLETKTEEDKRLIANWKYVNPGDAIDLHLLAAGVNDPEDVEIGVDAEGVEVRHSMLFNKCVNAMMLTGQVADSDDPPVTDN